MPISSGVHTVGPNRDYADWKAAADDLAAILSDDVHFLQLGEVVGGVNTAVFGCDLNGHKLVLSCPFPHKGHPNSGLKTSYAGSGDVILLQLTDSHGGGMVDVSNLYIERLTGSGSSASDTLVRVSSGVTSSAIWYYLHDLILIGNGEPGEGIRFSTKFLCKVWNVKGGHFDHASGGALIALQDHETYEDEARVENCTAHNCVRGFWVVPATGSVGKILNCVAFDNDFNDFSVNSYQLGSGNISKDGSAAFFSGINNLRLYDGVENSPDVATEFKSTLLTSYYLRIKDDATVLPSGGVPSEIDDSLLGTIRLCPRANKKGAEGNGRPGSDGLYSRGADEYREEFPGAWMRRARIFVDPAHHPGPYTEDPPLLVRRDAPGMPSDFASTCLPYGEDVRVTSDAEGLVQIPFEIFRFASGDEDFTLWTALELEPDQLTPIYIWWGNSNGATPPYNGSGPTGSGLDGGSRVWSGYEFVLHMGNEFEDLTWCKDSGGSKRHPWIENLPSWGFGFIGEGRDAGFNSTTRFNMQSVEGALKQASSISATGIASSSVTPHVDTIIEAVRSGVQRLLVRLNQKLLQTDARAPDSQPAQSITGDESFGLQAHRFSSIADIYNDRMTAYFDGEVDDDESKSFSAQYTDNTDLDTLVVGRQADGSNGYAGSLQELRLKNYALTAAWVKIVHENLRSGSDLFTGPYSGGACMAGARSFKFDAPGSGPFELNNTDFWLSYEGDGAGGTKLRLNGIWDKACSATLWGLARRQEIEAIVRELAEWFVGLRGTLTVDEGHAGEVSLSNVKLLSASWDEVSTNAGLIYTLEFGINLGLGGAVQFSRLLVFGDKALAADNLIVEHGGRDQTQFKEVFRAAPVRVPGGPPVKVVRVRAISEPLGPGGVAQRRREAEAIIRSWIDNQLGQEANLVIDGVGFGKAHLADVRAESLDTPEAAGYSLDFVIAYGS